MARSAAGESNAITLAKRLEFGNEGAGQLTQIPSNVSKCVSDGHENGPRGRTSGAISAGSGDRIRTCDLWVMS